ncbi:hypothetical protein J1614_010421 [Plenodomus biglobosus]|nr:hypothetical protein J1614_010421 [Plenodomus biglobosus]
MKYIALTVYSQKCPIGNSKKAQISTISMEDNMYHLRVATRADLPQLVTLVAEPFSSGSLNTAGLTFSQDEITAYLQWRLPRLLLDNKWLVLSLEFRPVNSFKKVPGRVVGCAILGLGASTSRPSSAGPSCKTSFWAIVELFF